MVVVEEEEEGAGSEDPPLGPYRRPVPRVLGGPRGVGVLLWARYPYGRGTEHAFEADLHLFVQVVLEIGLVAPDIRG